MPRTAVGGTRATLSRDLNGSMGSTRGFSKPGLPRPTATAGRKPVMSNTALLPALGAARNTLGQRAATAGNNTRPVRYGAQHAKNYGAKPFWRKSKKEQVDAKVGNLFESYRAIDTAAH